MAFSRSGKSWKIIHGRGNLLKLSNNEVLIKTAGRSFLELLFLILPLAKLFREKLSRVGEKS